MFWPVSTKSKLRLLVFSRGRPAHLRLRPRCGAGAFFRVKDTICRIDAESSTARMECISLSGFRSGIGREALNLMAGQNNSMEPASIRPVPVTGFGRCGATSITATPSSSSPMTSRARVSAQLRSRRLVDDQLGRHVLELQGGDRRNKVAHHRSQLEVWIGGPLRRTASRSSERRPSRSWSSAPRRRRLAGCSGVPGRGSPSSG